MKRLVAVFAVAVLAACTPFSERVVDHLTHADDAYVYSAFAVDVGEGIFAHVAPGTAVLHNLDPHASSGNKTLYLRTRLDGGRLGRFIKPGSYKMVGLEVSVGNETRKLRVPEGAVVTVQPHEVVDLGSYEVSNDAGEVWDIVNQSLFGGFRDRLVHETPDLGLRLKYIPLYP